MSMQRDTVIQAKFSEKQGSLLVRLREPILDPVWQVEAVHLEEIVLAYLGRSSEQRLPQARASLYQLEVEA